MTSIILAIVVCGCYGLYWLGYISGMNKASKMLDAAFEEKFKDAGIVVKKDDRIIECNGMMIPLQCKKCRFSRVNGDDVVCLAPDYDSIPVIGLTR